MSNKSIEDIRAWDSQPYDTKPGRTWPLHVRIIDLLGKIMGVIGYFGFLAWCAHMAPHEGAVGSTANAFSSPQAALLVWFLVLGLLFIAGVGVTQLLRRFATWL